MNYRETTCRVEISGNGYTMWAAWNQGKAQDLADNLDLFLHGLKRQLKEHGRNVPEMPSAKEVGRDD